MGRPNLGKRHRPCIDCGIKRLAVASTGKVWSAQKLLAVRDRHARVRASLQSKGTKGAKRVLKRLSKRESRYARWLNHNLSKEIVALAKKKLCGIIALEDLKYIRSRTKRWNKHANRMKHAWSFGQLQSFIEYKAALAGLTVKKVKADGTSQECHRCGEKGKRTKAKFVCTNGQTCGELLDADINAAKNIAARGADCNAARIGDELVRFFVHSSQPKAAGF